MARKNVMLASIDFPAYTIEVVGDRHFLLAGGGGQAKTGVSNAIEIFEIVRQGKAYTGRSVKRYEKDKQAIMNSDIISNGQRHVLAAGMDEECQLYALKFKVITLKHNDPQSEAVRKRKSPLVQSESFKNAEKITTFDIEPIEKFQSDFLPDNAFQKVVRFSKDGELLVTGGADGNIRVWKYPDATKLSQCQAHQGEIEDLDISPCGRRIVTISKKQASAWKTEGCEKVCELEWPQKTLTPYRYRNCRYGVIEGKSEQFNLYTTHIPVTQSSKPMPCYITLWDSRKFVPKKIAKAGNEAISTLAISNDGTYLGIGMIEGSVAVYISFSLQRLYYVKGAHDIFVTDLVFFQNTQSSRALLGDQDFTMLSISVDKHVRMHQSYRGEGWSILSCFVLFIFIIYILLTSVIYLFSTPIEIEKH